jgi:uncharacterized protein YecE (DUF72 family)
MMLSAGTSGFCYKEWRGHFYPEKLPESAMLRFYAARLSTVEINNTFYRMPSPKVLAGWIGEVPDGFTFTLKAPRRITHEKRLVDCEDHVSALLERSLALADRLGPLLFQLPPFLKKDVARLATFLALIPPGRQAAFEFRNDSWHDEEVHATLADRGAMLCVTDTDEGDTPFVVTAPTAYVRLRRTHYDDAELRAWAERIVEKRVERTYVYFMHEDDALGTKFAAQLNAHWDAIVRSR